MSHPIDEAAAVRALILLTTIRELLDETSLCDDFYFDKLCRVRMELWSKGRVALVGDAGYCPSPAAGMGGSVAILGAAALADAFQKYPGDLKMVFQEYGGLILPSNPGIQTCRTSE